MPSFSAIVVVVVVAVAAAVEELELSVEFRSLSSYPTLSHRS